jgi:hypothetical protein
VDGKKHPQVAKPLHVAIALLVVIMYLTFAGLALLRGHWLTACVMVPFLIIAVAMLRQRRQTGEPISFLTTVVRMLLGRHGRS